MAAPFSYAKALNRKSPTNPQSAFTNPQYCGGLNGCAAQLRKKWLKAELLHYI
jgi:hypothetical protein